MSYLLREFIFVIIDNSWFAEDISQRKLGGLDKLSEYMAKSLVSTRAAPHLQVDTIPP